MSDARPTEHVTTEQVSDLLEDLLPPAEARSVSAHLDGCERCAAVRDQLMALPDLLADAGAATAAMPETVAERLDAALRAEADRRASAHRHSSHRPSTHRHSDDEPAGATVVPLDSRRRRARKAMAGVLVAAAVVAGFVVVGDVLEQGSGDDAASTDAAGGSGDVGLNRDERDRPGPTESEATQGFRGQLDQLSSRNFAADATSALEGAPERTEPEARNGQPLEYSRVACSTAELDSVLGAAAAADVTRRSPLALLDGEPVTLLRTGPPERSVVVAYSCATGRPVAEARAVVDLTER